MQVKGVGYSLGVVYYDFPGTSAPSTTEIYGGLNFDVPLSPAVKVYHDVGEADGTYVSVGVGHSFERVVKVAGVGVGLDLGVSVGWGSASYNKYYWGADTGKLNDLSLKMAFPMEIAGWTVSPSVNYVTLLSDTIRDSDAYGTESDFFFAGISVNKSF